VENIKHVIDSITDNNRSAHFMLFYKRLSHYIITFAMLVYSFLVENRWPIDKMIGFFDTFDPRHEPSKTSFKNNIRVGIILIIIIEILNICTYIICFYEKLLLVLFIREQYMISFIIIFVVLWLSNHFYQLLL
jgi:hypothetical protein